MPHRDGIHIEEEELPGIGLRDDFMTAAGRRVGVVTHRDGHRELLIYRKQDADAVAESISLTEGEADILAEYLGTRLVMDRLSRVVDQVDSLDSERITVEPGTLLDGMTLGDAAIRQNTGASIVAIWRDKEVTASPMSDFRVQAGDSLVIIGSRNSLNAAKAVIGGV